MAAERKRRITPVQVSRGSVYVVRNSEPASAPAFGRTTRRFFAEGEAHEAHDWQDTILPFDDEPEERVPSGSFDKVPRRKGTMVALALFGIFVAAAVAFGVRAWMQGGRLVEAAVIDFVRGLGTKPAQAPPVSAPPARPPVAEKAAAATAPAFPAGSEAPTSPAGPLDDGAGASAGANLPENGANVATRAAAVPSDRKPRAEEEQEPPRRPLKMARQRPPMTLSKSSDPESALGSSLEEASAPFAAESLVPPRVAEPRIAPANTGAATPEKAPPSLEDLRVLAGDQGVAPAAGSEPDPFQPGEAK